MNTDTTFRTLCAELVEALDAELDLFEARHSALLDRARAALAAPEQGPTREELREMFDENDWNYISPETFEDIALTVLGEWGRPAVEPVPVAERLPGPEDCDAEGRCWYFFMDSVVGGCGWQMFNEEENELLAPSHFWLPHWALPVPQEGADG